MHNIDHSKIASLSKVGHQLKIVPLSNGKLKQLFLDIILC